MQDKYLHEETNGFSEYKRLILACLKETKENIEQMEGTIDKLKDDVYNLKLEMGKFKIIWSIVSAIIGFLSSLVPIIMHYILFTKGM